MTGEALYARYCKAVSAHTSKGWDPGLREVMPVGVPLRSWPFLSDRDRRVWNKLAKTVQHKPRRRRR